MSRAQRVLLWVSTVVLLASGSAYAYMRYLMHSENPFSAYNHPAQPWVLDLHVLAAPVLLFAVGWFWGNHILPKLQRNVRNGRGSGAVLLALIGVMTLSGYLLQTVTSPGWRLATAWTHGVSSVLFCGILIGHVLFNRESAAAGGRDASQSDPRGAAVRERAS